MKKYLLLVGLWAMSCAVIASPSVNNLEITENLGPTTVYEGCVLEYQFDIVTSQPQILFTCPDLGTTTQAPMQLATLSRSRAAPPLPRLGVYYPVVEIWVGAGVLEWKKCNLNHFVYIPQRSGGAAPDGEFQFKFVCGITPS